MTIKKAAEFFQVKDLGQRKLSFGKKLRADWIKKFWDNQTLPERIMLILALLFITLLCVTCVSSLTEEERIKNNQVIEKMRGRDGGIRTPVNSGPEINPFLILGIIVGIIILLIVIIAILKNRERV